MEANLSFNRFMNFVGETGYSLATSVLSGNLVPSTVLGAAGAWLTGVGTQRGIFQGAVSSLYYTLIQKQAIKYLQANTKNNDPNYISSNAGAFLYGVALLSSIAIPVILTKSYGHEAMKKLSDQFSPESVVNTWLLGPSATTREYSYFWGVAVSVAPTIVQHTLHFWRAEDKKTR